MAYHIGEFSKNSSTVLYIYTYIHIFYSYIMVFTLFKKAIFVSIKGALHLGNSNQRRALSEEEKKREIETVVF